MWPIVSSANPSHDTWHSLKPESHKACREFCTVGPRGTRAHRYKDGSHVQVTHSAVRGAHAPPRKRPRNAGGAYLNRSEHEANGAQCQNATAPALQARRRREDEALQALASNLPDEGYKAPEYSCSEYSRSTGGLIDSCVQLERRDHSNASTSCILSFTHEGN
ncbi:hypothetical protein MHYP_G00041130 [Metynnis hypsauchen]